MPHGGPAPSVGAWLDALASGAADEETSLHSLDALIRTAPDAAWEVLSLLDQYYRRGKIDDAVRRRVQSRLDETHHTVATPPPGEIHHTVATPPPAGVPRTRGGAAPIQPSRAPRTVAVGDCLRGRYRIAALLGEGGMGTVFEAVDEYRLDLPELSQRLALKVLHPIVSGRPEVFNELRHEFQHLQGLSHPNIVRVHEFDRDGELAFFTMELLRGAPLSRLTGPGRRPLDRRHALAIVRDAGAALAFAHAHGVVHGDIKPQNIFITEEGGLRVFDFGAAHAVMHGPWISDFQSNPGSPSATPAFASCEVLESLRPDARDDLYSFACVVYILLAGRHPFDELSSVEARSRRLQLLRPAGLSRGQWHALREGLAWSRSQRPRDFAAWLQRLDLEEASTQLPSLAALLATSPPPAPRRWTGSAVGATAAVVLVLVGGWLNGSAPGSAGARARTALETWAATRIGDARSFGLRLLAGARNLTAAAPVEAGAAVGRSDLGAARTAAADNTARADVARGVSAPTTAPAGAAAASSRLAALAGAAGSRGDIRAAPDRLELAADLVAVSVADPVARLMVRRRGRLNGETHFEWWTESGTAKPGDDFVPVMSRTERIADGKDGVKLLVPVVSDPARREARDFFIVIGNPGAGASLGARTRAMVIIPAAN